MALNKIKKASITADAIDDTKIADNAISEEHLDTTVVTGLTELSETANDSDVLIIYDASAGTLKKIIKGNVTLQNPTISSVSPTNVLTGDGTGNATFTITGTKFDATSTAKLVTAGGSEVNFDSVTRDSATQITAVIAISSLSNADEPYDVKVINGNGLTNTLTDQINIDASPTFVTSSGSLGTVSDGASGSFDIVATDPESVGNVTFEIQSGSIPPNMSTSTINENGVSKFRISGDPNAVSSNTTYNFVARAVDAASNTSSRSFSITVNAPPVQVFNSSGTFSVPSGVSSVDVLVVAGGGGGGNCGANYSGGGGGAGGLIFMPGYPVTPGGTVSVTVGCGGSAGDAAYPTPEDGGSGQDSVFGTLTAKGGGGGAATAGQPGAAGNPGGSGGGAAGRENASGGNSTQPTQPGNSGAYGFGNGGGNSTPAATGGRNAGGGGGGAGAAGQAGASPGCANVGGDGGIGKTYTIADGTSPVYYAGGGGAAASYGPENPGQDSGTGGQGGGGNAARGPVGVAPTNVVAQAGTANRGGGGGAGAWNPGIPGGSDNTGKGAAGGKGVVVVRWTE